MPERRPNTPSKGSGPGGRVRRPGRRAADRHYLAVVAAEARRLARELRPSANGGPPSATPIGGDAPAEVLP